MLPGARLARKGGEENLGWVHKKRGQQFPCLLAWLMLPQQARSPLHGSSWNQSTCGFEDYVLPGTGKATQWDPH